MSLFDLMARMDAEYAFAKNGSAEVVTAMNDDNNGNDSGNEKAVAKAATTTAAGATEAHEDDDNAGGGGGSNDDEWLTNSPQKLTTAAPGRKQITFWDTQAPRNVKLKDLVFAPYYRCRDKLMPARICQPSECATVKHISMPFPANEVPVEFICMEEFPDTRILLVSRCKVVPYWNSAAALKRGEVDYVDQGDPPMFWNPDQRDATHKALVDRYAVKIAQQAFDRVIARADEFLR